MKTHTIKTYGIRELSDDARQEAISNNRDWNTDHDWWTFIESDWRENILPSYSYLDAKIQFSGFWSQGDGASFEASIDLAQWIASRPKYKPLKEAIEAGEINAIIRRISSHYSHENTCRAEVEIEGDTEDEALLTLINELEKELEDERLDLCKQLYKQLEDEYEYLSSDEIIAENFEINETQFLEDGTLAPPYLQ